jgi:hypothetical protein
VNASAGISSTSTRLLKSFYNGNTLDNRRANLRLASPPQNAHNCKVARTNNTTGFKGVSFDKPRGRWIAYIRVLGKRYNLGRFNTAEEAAREYDRAARLAFGQFARINFPFLGFQCLQDRPPKFSPIVVKARILNGEEHPSAKLSNRQVRAIRCTFKSSSSQSLAEMFNVSKTTTWSIRNGKGYQSV